MRKALSTARPRTVMVAMVLGTALSSFSPAAAKAAPNPQAVQDISRYCQACWRNARLHPDSWADCTQEVFARLLERVAPAKWDSVLRPDGEERREFLRAIDAVKKRTQRGRKWSGLAEDIADLRSAPEMQRNELREAVEKAARDVLSPRQQRILNLTCAGWSVPEIADELQTTVDRVSDEKYKAIRKLRRELATTE